MSTWVKSRIEAIRIAREAENNPTKVYWDARGAPEKVRTGSAIPAGVELEYEWFPIDEGPVRFWVFRDAGKINGVRIDVSAAEAQAWADELGALLTTPKIEDLIYKHASVKIPPFPSDVVSTTEGQHSAKIDKAIGNQSGLVATVGKSWVLTDKLSPTVAANYGWHTAQKASEPSVSLPSVNVWQGVGHKHNPHHRDYSQTLRLVSRKVVINGKVWDLEQALRDPSVAHHFSHVGALKVTRQPGADIVKANFPTTELETEYWKDGISHAEARAALVEAFKKVLKREPTLREAQFAQAVSLGESGYGQWAFTNRVTGEKIRNTWNMGAVQCKQLPPCPPGCFEATDTRADGSPYQACFVKYPSPIEGFEHFLTVLYINRGRKVLLDAANKGDIANFSTLMRASGYFELGLKKHIAGMTKNLGIITKALGEPMPGSGSSSSKGGLIAGLIIAAGLGALAIAKG